MLQMRSEAASDICLVEIVQLRDRWLRCCVSSLRSLPQLLLAQKDKEAAGNDDAGASHRKWADHIIEEHVAEEYAP